MENFEELVERKRKQVRSAFSKAILEAIFYITLAFLAPWYVTLTVFLSHFAYNLWKR